MSYTHRNGETEPPSEPGWYWFDGRDDNNVMRRGPIDVQEPEPLSIAWTTWSEGWDSLDAFSGRWWGPIIPPWEQSPGTPLGT